MPTDLKKLAEVTLVKLAGALGDPRSGDGSSYIEVPCGNCDHDVYLAGNEDLEPILLAAFAKVVRSDADWVSDIDTFAAAQLEARADTISPTEGGA